MRKLKIILAEFSGLALLFGLTVSGWQTALASKSMPEQLESPIKWIHFALYSLGGHILLGILFLLPGLIVGFLVIRMKKNWEPGAIRRFLLAGAIGIGIVLILGLLKPALVKPVVMTGGFNATSVAAIVLLIIAAYFVGVILSVGFLGLLESRKQATQWCLFWGWWIFMSVVPPMVVSLAGLAGTVPSVVVIILALIIACVVFYVLLKALPLIYAWLQNGKLNRPTIAIGVLLLVYIVTFPFPGRVEHGLPADENSPPVVLITIDTLRPDALDFYPVGDCFRLGTPNLNRIAEEGVVFERAWSTAPWTLPSVGTILSGLPPSAHGALDNESSVLASGATTIAEILSESGYATGAVVVNSMLGQGSGMEQGFQSYEEEYMIHQLGRKLLFQKLINRIWLTWPEPWTPNYDPFMERDAVVRASRFIINHAGERFFLWVHLFAPHSIWYPPVEYRERIAEEFGIEVPRRDIMRQPIMKTGSTNVTPEILDGILGLYAGEVAFSDDMVAAIVEELEESDILDDCLLVITSDHGEEFYEHDRVEHGHSLYPELLHVPLFMRFPETIQAGMRVNDRVSLVDLAPTILDLAGVEAGLSDQEGEFTGRSLVPLIKGENLTQQPLFAEDPLWFDRGMQGILLDDFYYIGGSYTVVHPRLYDLESDPKAWFDLLRNHPEVADRMSNLLEEYNGLCAEIAEKVGAGGNYEMMERFRSLGYLN